MELVVNKNEIFTLTGFEFKQYKHSTRSAKTTDKFTVTLI